MRSIPATQDRYHDILSAVMSAVDIGGKQVRICEEGDERKATAEERSDAQRALDWVWNRQIGKHVNNRPEWVHGESKLSILLPMYYTFGDARRKRAEHLNQIMSHLTEYKYKVSYAFDSVRTKTLPVKQMAEYLTEKQYQYAQKGIVLESNSDLEFKSLMVYADGAK